MKNFRTAIVLAAILGIFTAVAYWDDWQTKKDEVAEKAKNQLIEVPKNLKSITYTSVDEESKAETNVKLAQANGKWQVVAPVNAVADQDAVKNLITTISDYRYIKEVGHKKSEWAGFGLDKPVRSVVFESEDGKATGIYVGMKSPVGFNAFVATDKTETVYLGSQSILMGTAKTLRDFRNKRLAQIGRDHLSAITFETKGEPPVRIIKEKGDYKITEPAAYEADQDSVLNLLSDLDGALVNEFIDVPKPDLLAKFGNGQYQTKIAWQYEDGTTQQLTFAVDKDAYYAAYDPQKVVFKLEPEFKNKISKKLIDFRNRRIFSFEAADVLSIEVDGTAYQKVKGDWQLASEKDNPKTKTFIQNLVTDIQYAKTEKFLVTKDVAKHIQTAPMHRVKLAFADTNKTAPIVIDVWQSRDDIDKYYVRVDNGAGIYQVDKSFLLNTTEPKAGAKDVSTNLKDLEGLSN